ncbi:MAG: hypothetical protein IRZ16_08570 [Myxococcaceae bacterium]|nr:hypothetical protein [Myxococcaceae bacterium]
MDEALRQDAVAARSQVRSGGLRGTELLRRLRAVPLLERDAWTDVLLGLEEEAPDTLDLPPESIPYLPCGVDEILRMVEEAPLGADDVFVDLGSGAGRVVMLAHLLTGARAVGVEIQGLLVTHATASSAALGLSGVSFVHANAADTELEGSVFFLYAPFNGETLKRVLRRLEEVARKRPIRICALGLELASEGWLRRRETSSPWLSLYDSVPVDDAPNAPR